MARRLRRERRQQCAVEVAEEALEQLPVSRLSVSDKAELRDRLIALGLERVQRRDLDALNGRHSHSLMPMTSPHPKQCSGHPRPQTMLMGAATIPNASDIAAP